MSELRNEIINLITNIPYIGIIVINKNGIIKLVNSTFTTYVQKSKDELLGKNIVDYDIDPGLLKVIESQKPDLLAFYPDPKLIAMRHPVYKNGELVGVYGQYISLDPRDIKRNIFGKEYISLISSLETMDITLNFQQLMIELNSYKDEFHKTHATSFGVNHIKGTSPEINKLKEQVLTVANSPSSVLVTGESGTGKELFAEIIHTQGNRSTYPFIKVNCAAIPENLLEAELFGYDDGAFTGARKGGKMGKFELANKGTILLDEIGDMSLTMQAKLLRVLQGKEIERVGGENTIPIDVRVISATNKNLMQLINDGAFREDLYYRLNVINLHIPPLRDRREDIFELANYMVEIINQKLNRTMAGISTDAMKLLLNYDWPGNIRELINVIEAAMNFCNTSVLGADDLRFFVYSTAISNNEGDDFNLKNELSDVEKAKIKLVLNQSNGNRKAAASKLGVSRTTLYRMMKKHGLL